VEAVARLPDTRMALITCEPEDRLPPQLRQHLAGHWRIDDPLDPGQIAAAVQGLSRQLGPVERLLAVLEQLQVPLAQVREHLGIGGMDPVTANNFRDKAQMKTVLRAAGVPCARHKLAVSAADALEFSERVGFPLVVKPPAGAGAKSTFRLDDAADLSAWLDTVPPAPDRPAQMEEFLTGDEGSYDSVMVDGQVVSVRPDSTDYDAWMKANPGKINFVNQNAAANVTGVMFENLTGQKVQFIPYRGAGPAMTDLVSGTVDLLVVQGAVALPQIRAGKIKALANLSATRSASMPDIPTADETGVPGLYMSGWFGFWAPKGTPKDIIGKLNNAVANTLADPSIRLRLVDLGVEIPTPEQQKPEAFAALQKADAEPGR